VLSFIFGKGTGVSTPQELSRRREIARTLMERNAGRVPQTAWEGLNAVVEAIGARIENSRLDSAEAAGRERATAKFNALFNDQANLAPVTPHGAGTFPDERGARLAPHPTPALADAYSDPWLSDEQRSMTRSIWEGSAGMPKTDAEGGVVSQPSKRKPVVKPRLPNAGPSVRGIEMKPSGLGMTVDNYGNIVGWP
jgi:hypothetical protein